jgi:hypothetical protein
MTANPFMDRNNDTTRWFLCCLHNRTIPNEKHLNGLTPEEVYDKIMEGRAIQGPEGVHKTRLITQLVTACIQNGFIEQVWIWWQPPSGWTSPWNTDNSPQFWWWEPPSFGWWRLTWSGRIRMTPAGRRLCNSIDEEDGKSYCASGKAPSCKE